MIQAAVSVKTVKLRTSPAMIAYGRRRPPAAPPASRIGSTGRTHGEIAVTTPARKPIRRSSTIYSYMVLVGTGFVTPLPAL